MKVFEFIIGRSLFRYEVNDELNLTETENVLYQMTSYTGDDFRAEQLNVWPLAANYFTSQCKSIGQFCPYQPMNISRWL